LTRVVLESDGRAFRLDLHPRFAVVSGLEPAERRSLTQALVTAIGPGRRGLHLEVRADDDRHLAVFRPPGRPARVVDVDHAVDVTATFADVDGRPDLAASCGVVRGEATKRMVLGPDDLESRSSVEDRVATLARLDQARLWEVADKVNERAHELAEVAGDVDDLDPGLVATVDDRHRAFEAAQAEQQRRQRVWLLFGANAALLALPVAALVGWWLAVPLLILAGVMTAWSARQWQVVEQARRAEQEALDEAGAGSFMAFQIARVERVMGSESRRRQMTDAAAAHRAALAEWGLLAGTIEVEWALAHRNEVRDAAAARRRSEDRSPMAAVRPAVDEAAAEALTRLRANLGIRSVGRPTSESLPLICDDPLVDLDPAAKPAMLEELVEASRSRQVIFLTGDPDIAAWSRVEALTGEVGLVEGAPVR
jgi:hypothetical protein